LSSSDFKAEPRLVELGADGHLAGVGELRHRAACREVGVLRDVDVAVTAATTTRCQGEREAHGGQAGLGLPESHRRSPSVGEISEVSA
jgi:hypothetical protein